MDYKLKAKEYENQFKSDLKELVQILSLEDMETKSEKAPFGKGCREALDKMMEIGRNAGFNVRDIDGYACVIEYGDQEESIGVLGHLDIVPIGDDWTHDPLGCEEKDGFIFGRGVLDDKGPLVACLTAMRILKDNNIQLNKKIQLICGCNEETGMECMKYYCEHEKLPEYSFTPDANFPVIYGEKGGLNLTLTMKNDTCISHMSAGERVNVVIGKASACVRDDNWDEAFDFYLRSQGLKGSLKDHTLQIEGMSAHASMPWLGVNAGLHVLNFVGSVTHHHTLSTLAQMLLDWRGGATNIACEGAYMGSLTCNTGIIQIDENDIKIHLDIRYPNDTNGDDIYNHLVESFKENELDVKVEKVSDSVPLFLDPNSDFIQTLMKVYREYSGDDFTPAMTMGGGTYARKLPNCVAFGPEFPNPKKADFVVGGPHQADEAINIDEMMTSIAIYTAALVELGK